MIKNVIHRDGIKEAYKLNKIKEAIEICIEVNKKTKLISIQQINKILQEVDSTLHKNYNNKEVNVEDIQDVVVNTLKKVNESVALDYQRYREKRDRIRDMNYNGKYYNTILELASCVPNEVSHENGNKDATQFNVMRDLIAGETCKKIYKDSIMSPYLLELHNKGAIHIHDLDYKLMKGMTNCCVPNLNDMLQNGTCINGKRIKKPHRLIKATTIATQIITGIANAQFGGVTISISHLAPFIEESRKYYENFFNEDCISVAAHHFLVNKMLSKEIEDSIQTLLYQLNSMTSTNGQAPFITVFCYAKENLEYEEDTAMLILELFKQRYEGMEGPNGNNINPAFPKIVFAVEEDDKLYKDRNGEWKSLKAEAAKCTARRMVPDYMSVKIAKQFKEGLVIPPMGCRSFLHPWKNKEGKYQIYGRGNIGVMTINLPYIALSSKDYDDFIVKLTKIINLLCSEQNKVYKTIAETSSDCAPLLWQYGAFGRLKVGEKIGKILKNGSFSASIGYMGLAECVYHFGKEYCSKEGQALGLKIFKTMFDLVKQNKEKYNLALSLYGTPAENTTTKFAQALKIFPKEKHVNDRDYITNSYHIPVEYKIDGYSKIEFEAPFQEYSSGGCLSYCEMPDIRKNPEAVLNVMKCIYDNMMYCELNTTSCDTCYSCGYEGEIHMDSKGKLICPNCGETNPSNLYAVRRLCGYLGVLTNGISKGRIADINNRVKHF